MVVCFAILLTGQKNHNEKYYQGIHCKMINGKVEYRLPSGRRVDCLTNKYAIEHDFASKVYECVGQAIYYSSITGKVPVCALIIENKTDERFLDIIETIKQSYVNNLELVLLFPNGNGVDCTAKNKELCNN